VWEEKRRVFFPCGEKQSGKRFGMEEGKADASRVRSSSGGAWGVFESLVALTRRESAPEEDGRSLASSVSTPHREEKGWSFDDVPSWEDKRARDVGSDSGWRLRNFSRSEDLGLRHRNEVKVRLHQECSDRHCAYCSGSRFRVKESLGSEGGEDGLKGEILAARPSSALAVLSTAASSQAIASLDSISFISPVSLHDPKTCTRQNTCAYCSGRRLSR